MLDLASTNDPTRDKGSLRSLRMSVAFAAVLFRACSAIRRLTKRLGSALGSPTTEPCQILRGEALHETLGWRYRYESLVYSFAETQRLNVARLSGDRILLAERKHGTVMSHHDLLAADAAQLQLQRLWRASWREWDVVIHPAAAIPAFPRNHSEPIAARHLNDGGRSYRHRDACLVWPDPTTCGLPATAAPIDRSPAVLPIGVQIIGPHLGDRTTIGFAELLGRAFGGLVPPPQC